MRKRFLAALIAGAVIVGGLTGCGNQSTASNEQSSAYNSSATTSGYVDENGAHAGDDGTFANVGGGGSSRSSEPSTDASNDSDGDNPAEVSSSDENLEQSESESNSDEATQSTGRPSVRPQAEEVSLDNLHGIIAAYLYWDTVQPKYPMAQVFCIDPETGEMTLVNNFGGATSNTLLYVDTAYNFAASHYTEYRSNYRRCFSNDFRKMAVTMSTQAATEFHGDTYAGWLDENGNFTNVITTLGWESKNEFEEPVSYISVGFMDDGRFLFARRGANGGNEMYLVIPTDNITEAAIEEFEIDPFAKPYILVDDRERSSLNVSMPSVQQSVTYQLDETHFLFDSYTDPETHKGQNSCISILDIETGEWTKCVSGGAMHTWCGVADPTGTQIVFFAVNPKNTAETASLYIGPLDASSTPQKLESSYNVHYYPYKMDGEISIHASYCTLLDWR